MKIALVNVINKKKKIAMNKGLNGGLGTADDYGKSIPAKIISLLKGRSIKLPILSMAFLQAVLKEKDHEVKYYEGDLPKEFFDVILIYGSIVDYRNENEAAADLKKEFPGSVVGVFGPFPSRYPDYFPAADFVLLGEVEGFFQNEFRDIKQLKGNVPVSKPTDIDSLPSPDYDGFPIMEYSYYPVIKEKPFLVLQTTKGCPYSCGYYCTYGEYQGILYRKRSADKVIKDIETLIKKYKVRGIQFRDPTFGIHKDHVREICRLIKEKGIKIRWGMETRLDLLNKEAIDMMYDVGLRNINVGVETIDPEIARKNKRLLVQSEHQEEIVKYCTKKGVKVSAFYILGYDGDTIETMKKTIDYAKKLNTIIARFAVSTPYPGTKFFAQLKSEDRILIDDFEQYTQFNLVFKHNNLTKEQVQNMLQKALVQYYFRPAYIANLLKWSIKDFLS